MVPTSGSHVLGARAGCVRPPGSGHHLSCTSSGLLLVALFTLALTATDTSAVIIYRLGTPFSAAERDSLRDLSIDFEEIIRALNEIGYDGPLSVEWEDSGMDREAGAAEAASFLKKIDFKPSEIAFDAQFAE